MAQVALYGGGDKPSPFALGGQRKLPNPLQLGSRPEPPPPSEAPPLLTARGGKGPSKELPIVNVNESLPSMTPRAHAHFGPPPLTFPPDKRHSLGRENSSPSGTNLPLLPRMRPSGVRSRGQPAESPSSLFAHGMMPLGGKGPDPFVRPQLHRDNNYKNYSEAKEWLTRPDANSAWAASDLDRLQSIKEAGVLHTIQSGAAHGLTPCKSVNAVHHEGSNQLKFERMRSRAAELEAQIALRDAEKERQYQNKLHAMQQRKEDWFKTIEYDPRATTPTFGLRKAPSRPEFNYPGKSNY